jgi:hypothetical protein
LPDVRNKYSMLNTYDSGPSSLQGGYQSSGPQSLDSGYDSRRMGGGSSRSMIVTGRGSRGPSAEPDRNRSGAEAVRPTPRTNGPRDHEVGGPAASLGPQASGRPVPGTIKEVNLVVEQAKLLNGKPDMSNTQIEKQAKLLLDEYLNDENEKVKFSFFLFSI